MKPGRGGSITPIREPKALPKTDDVGVGQECATLARNPGERGMKSLGHYRVPVYPSSLSNQARLPTPRYRMPTATVIMVESVCRTREILRNCGYVLRAGFPTEVLRAGIYSSVIFGGSMVWLTL